MSMQLRLVIFQKFSANHATVEKKFANGVARDSRILLGSTNSDLQGRREP